MHEIETKNYHKLRRENEITSLIKKLRIIIAKKPIKRSSLVYNIRLVKLKSWMEKIKSQLETIKLKLKLKLQK